MAATYNAAHRVSAPAIYSKTISIDYNNGAIKEAG